MVGVPGELRAKPGLALIVDRYSPLSILPDSVGKLCSSSTLLLLLLVVRKPPLCKLLLWHDVRVRFERFDWSIGCTDRGTYLIVVERVHRSRSSSSSSPLGDKVGRGGRNYSSATFEFYCSAGGKKGGCVQI
ncbi:hypothetical protein T4B_13829 [Trichinella pseudospiralis]|uniref:Uncharacterized protein n=1 Tax=Trichinella pseudospiralis TaxID=6337 RepID=A0A0V1HEU8_TRIPS|nr:hypothetical protein T4A_4266 [Trichinella pseudospiralis]KRZ09213.1 hypothetical protein T4B_13829 [Trichinella pseudospiralis]